MTKCAHFEIFIFKHNMWYIGAIIHILNNKLQKISFKNPFIWKNGNDSLFFYEVILLAFITINNVDACVFNINALHMFKDIIIFMPNAIDWTNKWENAIIIGNFYSCSPYLWPQKLFQVLWLSFSKKTLLYVSFWGYFRLMFF